jgi:thiamine biosynthesis protein ThiS
MKLTINGQEKDFPSELKLSELVQQLGMKPERVAVELNREIAQRDRWQSIELHDGDRLEIVHFVGGGAGR